MILPQAEMHTNLFPSQISTQNISTLLTLHLFTVLFTDQLEVFSTASAWKRNLIGGTNSVRFSLNPVNDLGLQCLKRQIVQS